MIYKPHEYQRQATQFLLDHKRAALFLDMGLGKTSITLTAVQELLFERFEVARVLVIAPLRVARDTWPAEVEKWEHLRGLRLSVVVGTEKQRAAALEADADVWVINRENIDWLVNFFAGRVWPFDMLIIDELSSFKNHQSKRFKALKRVLPYVNRVVGLTGTPAPNGLIDLWAQFRVLDGGERLGKSIGRYRRTYFIPEKTNGYVVYSYALKRGAEDAIYRAIGGITLSMRAGDYLRLPGLTETSYSVDIPVPETYRELRREMVASVSGGVVDAANAAVLAGKLQQLASGAVYGENQEVLLAHDAKLDALEDLVEAANGQPVLVAYWFAHELERIRERLPQARVLSSSGDFKAWNAGRVSVGLIHPASAGHGLNLQAGGHILIWFSLPWSLEAYQQTVARLYRQGQEKPVSVIRIVAENTIDEQIIQALDAKSVTQSALIDAVKAQVLAA